ncbi:hypothetical protein BXY64_4118 [Marinifilum flexuosum]|uniref:CAAX prenyl protease 2/Lysostaphin resistance protein A-like domain-containing protein n=1 Tax=Marinifilum flexuosum TaxID=1117708 RepID=A0A419WG97_9BACT|nr:hypothetical protein BXY64_4118 [Marinifilum flexuosum]
MKNYNRPIKLLYFKWLRLKPIKFIVATTLLGILFTIPIKLILDFTGVGDSDIGGFDFERSSQWEMIITVIILAPLIETLLCQLLPIKLIQVFKRNHSNLIALLVSSLVFSLAHYSYSVWYSLMVLPMGFFLAKTYLVFQRRKESSFWMTTAVHASRNLIALMVIL